MPNGSRLSEAKQRLLEMQRRGNLISPPAATSEPRWPRETPAPLSFAQEQVWRLDQTASKLAALHNESITLHRRGPCDFQALERSLAEIVRRHEIWRTTFEIVEGKPVQIIHPVPANFKLPVVDLRELPENQRENAALELATRDARLTFDLNRWPLFRATLVTLNDAEHRLFLTAHQSIVDGITVFDLFPFELTALYESFVSGQPSPLPELEAQYADFACWQRRTIVGEALAKQLAYWEKKLTGELPVLAWPNEFPRPAQRTYRGAIQPFR